MKKGFSVLLFILSVIFCGYGYEFGQPEICSYFQDSSLNDGQVRIGPYVFTIGESTYEYIWGCMTRRNIGGDNFDEFKRIFGDWNFNQNEYAITIEKGEKFRILIQFITTNNNPQRLLGAVEYRVEIGAGYRAQETVDFDRYIPNFLVKFANKQLIEQNDEFLNSKRFIYEDSYFIYQVRDFMAGAEEFCLLTRTFYVEIKYQRKSIGTELLEYIKDFLNCKIMIIWIVLNLKIIHFMKNIVE